MTTWQLRPEFHNIPFQAKDVAALFVSSTAHWYGMLGNELHGKKNEVYRLICEMLQNGEEPEFDPRFGLSSHGFHYVLNKFQREWVDLSGKTKDTVFINSPSMKHISDPEAPWRVGLNDGVPD
jgi:hypothetical protein